MKKSLSLAVAALAAVLIIWSSRPLKSREWDIEFDDRLQAGKEAYLKSLAAEGLSADAPNVILIIADDLGMTDISLYGADHLQTPNIDSIGYDGRIYTEAYASAPICSPSRAGLLTGRYQNRYGFDSQPMTRYARTPLEWFVTDRFINTEPMYPIRNESIPFPDQIDLQGMPPSEVMLSEALSSAGYQCDIVGKWHLGYGDLQYPTNRGFDSFFGFLEAFSYFVDPARPDVESWQFDEFSEKHIWKQEREGYCAVQRDGVVIEEESHLTDAFAREAADRIHSASADESPYFLYVPFSAPHTPFQALTEYTERFSHVEDPRKRIYYAMIAQLDDAVGEILAAVDASGESENTIVIFTSDNGGATYTQATGNDPLRGGKMSHFEGGLAVPMMLRWPEKIASGTYDTAPVIHLDLFESVLAAAGLSSPSDRIMDGSNILNPGSSEDRDERPLFWRSDYNRIVRSGDWKLILNGKDGRKWLYNVSEDREEDHNLIDVYPGIAEELESLIWAWDEQMMSPSWPRVMDYFYNEEGEEYWFAT